MKHLPLAHAALEAVCGEGIGCAVVEAVFVELFCLANTPGPEAPLAAQELRYLRRAAGELESAEPS